MKFRKKSAEVDAILYSPDSRSAVIAFGGDAVQHQAIDDDGAAYDLANLRVRTLNGVVTLSQGEWLVRGVMGEFYPCRADIFDATYEAVVPGEPGLESMGFGLRND